MKYSGNFRISLYIFNLAYLNVSFDNKFILSYIFKNMTPSQHKYYSFDVNNKFRVIDKSPPSLRIDLDIRSEKNNEYIHK